MAPRPSRNRPLSHFGENFEAWRKEQGLSQSVVAQLIGTQQRTLSDWLRVDGMPGAVHHLARLAVLMGSDVEGLVGADAGTEQLRDADYVYELLLRVVSPAVAKRFLDQRHRQNGQADDEEQA